MKNTGICPKCQSSEIIIITGDVGALGNNINTGFRVVKVTRYLCASCGYIEEWIDNPKDIERLKKTFSD